MADLDGDGILDVISGSYWPGDIWLFRGEGDGKFARRAALQKKDGTNVNAGGKWKNKNDPDMDSLAASPWLQDVDDDGDLDLLVGNIAGNLILIENEGDAKHPVFGDKKARVQAGGKDLNAGRNDSGPTTADWDGDGLWDLIVGSGDGSVTFYKNTGTKKAMRFAAGVELIAKNNAAHEIAQGQEPSRSVARSKPHVCDWNLDGRLDLLVGDYVSVKMPDPVLTAAQKKERDKLLDQRDLVALQMDKLRNAHEGEVLSGAPKQEMQKLSQEYARVNEQLRPLQRGNRSTGWVWVYLQKKPPTRG